jgi:hypothetical protein
MRATKSHIVMLVMVRSDQATELLRQGNGKDSTQFDPRDLALRKSGWDEEMSISTSSLIHVRRMVHGCNLRNIPRNDVEKCDRCDEYDRLFKYEW